MNESNSKVLNPEQMEKLSLGPTDDIAQEQGDQPRSKLTVAVVGATGYIGGRLTHEFLARGYRVRAIARSGQKLRCRAFFASRNVEMAVADATDEVQLLNALEGCHAAYYLVHSAGRKTSDSPLKDQLAAINMVRAAEHAKLTRLVYLSGIADEKQAKTSSYLRSRFKVGEILASGRVPLTWLRTAPIIGSGGVLFEMVRHLVERFPIIIEPRWMRNISRPVAITDIIECLADCLANSEITSLSISAVGPDRVSLREILDAYAEEARVPKPLMVPLPFDFPELSAYCINLITPVPGYLARMLIEDFLTWHDKRDKHPSEVISIQPTRLREAIRTALRKVRQQLVETCWSDAGELKAPEWISCDGPRVGARAIFECNYKAVLDCSAESLWKVIRTVGGKRGWFFGNTLWQLRGFFDRLFGGVGLSRGRRHSEEIRTGDALDFWRVLLAEENQRLTLLAEMMVPGEAVLSFNLNPLKDGCELIQIARFSPRGLMGLCYWYAMAPFHDFLFKGMLTNIARRSGCQIRQGPQKFVGAAEICRLPADWGKNDLESRPLAASTNGL